MRLIDADALKDHLQSLAYDDWNQGASTSWADAYRECADMVDEQPTIEPERKKGRWIPDNNSVYETRFVCSLCRESQDVPTIGFTKYIPIWDYCPNCGADMRGERDEGD